MSPRHTTSCAIAALCWSRRIFWERQIRPWTQVRSCKGLTRLHFAAVLADEICSGGAAGHFALELFKSPPRLVLAIVHEPDGRIAGHWPTGNRHGILANRLIDVIIAGALAAGGPFEPDRRHRTGTDLRVAVGLAQLRRERLVLDHGFFRLAMGFGLFENAGNGRKRIVGGVALTQNLGLRIEQRGRELRYRR